MGKIRCAIIGLGRIGSLLEDDQLREKPCTHAGAIAGSRDCVLVGGCDIKAERRTLFSRRWNCSNVFSDMEDLVRSTGPDMVDWMIKEGTDAKWLLHDRDTPPLIAVDTEWERGKPWCLSLSTVPHRACVIRADQTDSLKVLARYGKLKLAGISIFIILARPMAMSEYPEKSK